MTHFYVFNGDADGLCALQQIRLNTPSCSGILVSGVKRDVDLLRRVNAAHGDTVDVFDISLNTNRDALLQLLENGVRIRYFDHHYAGSIPSHPNFMSYIDGSVDVCTSVLVDRYCRGGFHHWAIAAAFGDNLQRVALAMAKAAELDGATIDTLQHLGKYLNYNAYGETVSDLHFNPLDLAELLRPFEHPLDFARNSAVYSALATGYENDMALMRQIKPTLHVSGATLFVLPETAWARRAVGEFANEKIREHPTHALAVLGTKACGNFMVSVRVPATNPVGADVFCRRFATGGGRTLAGGINHLPNQEAHAFISAFSDCFA
ncbi:MAG TPA: acetyltransferase [Burkholderiaceae bacterium]|jgi:hypothetical protein